MNNETQEAILKIFSTAISAAMQEADEEKAPISTEINISIVMPPFMSVEKFAEITGYTVDKVRGWRDNAKNQLIQPVKINGHCSAINMEIIKRNL